MLRDVELIACVVCRQCISIAPVQTEKYQGASWLKSTLSISAICRDCKVARSP